MFVIRIVVLRLDLSTWNDQMWCCSQSWATFIAESGLPGAWPVGQAAGLRRCCWAAGGCDWVMITHVLRFLHHSRPWNHGRFHWMLKRVIESHIRSLFQIFMLLDRNIEIFIVCLSSQYRNLGLVSSCYWHVKTNSISEFCSRPFWFKPVFCKEQNG